MTPKFKYSRDCGWPRRLWPNAGRRKQKNKIYPKKILFFLHISSSYANTPGTVGGPGGGDRTLAVESRKRPKNQFFFVKNKFYPKNIFLLFIYLLVMPKYWGKQIFSFESFPWSGSKAKDVKEREKDWTMVKTMAKLRMAHASTHGAHKPPGPIFWHN